MTIERPVIEQANEIRGLINTHVDKQGLERDLLDSHMERPGTIVIAVDLAQVASGKFYAHISSSIPAEIIGTVLYAVGEQLKRQYSGMM